MGDLRKIGDGNADADRAMDYWDCIPADCMRNTDGAADSLPPGITFMFGVVYWIMCAITVVSAWGPAALILGVLFGFAGPSAMAPMILPFVKIPISWRWITITMKSTTI